MGTSDGAALARLRRWERARERQRWAVVVLGLLLLKRQAEEAATPPPYPRVLMSGVDTLHLFTTAQLRPEILATFERLKREAKDKVGSQEVVSWACLLDDELECQFEMSARGVGSKGCAYRLSVENELELLVHSNPPEGTPSAYVELHSRFLWARGFEDAARLAVELLSIVCSGEVAAQVTRVDLAADFCGPWVPTLDLFDKFHGRAVSRSAHVEYDDQREDQASFHMEHRAFTGFSFGRGVVVARIYNKSREIRRTNKLWFRPLWRKAGVWRNEEKDGDVWRLEFQLRREAVKSAHIAQYDDGEHQVAKEIASWDGCRRGLGNIWRSLSRSWLSLRLPRSASERVRLRPHWVVLNEAPDFPSIPNAELYRRALDVDSINTAAALAGYLKRAIVEDWQKSRRPGFMDGELIEREVLQTELHRACAEAVEMFERRHGSFYGAAIDGFVRAEGRRALCGDFTDQVLMFLGSRASHPTH